MPSYRKARLVDAVAPSMAKPSATRRGVRLAGTASACATASRDVGHSGPVHVVVWRGTSGKIRSSSRGTTLMGTVVVTAVVVTTAVVDDVMVVVPVSSSEHAPAMTAQTTSRRTRRRIEHLLSVVPCLIICAPAGPHSGAKCPVRAPILQRDQAGSG